MQTHEYWLKGNSPKQMVERHDARILWWSGQGDRGQPQVED